MKKILLLLLAGSLLTISCCQAFAADGKQRVMIGTILRKPGTGIYSLMLDPKTGALSDLRMENSAVGPSFLAFPPDSTLLYGFGGADDRTAWLRSFRVGSDRRTLTAVDSIPAGLSDFCHAATLNGGRIVAYACYPEGKLAYAPVDSEGRFGKPTIIDHNTQQTAAQGKKAHAHQIRQDPAGKSVYATDLGLDRVFIYEVRNGALVKNGEIATAEGAGPRHVDFHPSGNFMALVNELNSTVAVYARDGQGRYTQEIQVIPTYEAGYEGRKSAADIHYSPDGRFLYVSERGFNGVVAYAVDGVSGMLTRIGAVTEGIEWPRNFGIDPTGRWLLVANERGNSIVVYAIDPETGALTFTPHRMDIPAPSCILF